MKHVEEICHDPYFMIAFGIDLCRYEDAILEPIEANILITGKNYAKKNIIRLPVVCNDHILLQSCFPASRHCNPSPA